MTTHVVLTCAGVLVAIALVAWIQPVSTGGTTFIVVVTLLAVNALGALVLRFAGARKGAR